MYIVCFVQAGSRKVLLDVVPIVWNDVSALIKSSMAARSPLLRKYLVKLTQRVGLVCLPYRSPSWHYKVSAVESLCFIAVTSFPVARCCGIKVLFIHI